MKTLDVNVGLYDHYASIEQVYHYYGILAIYGLLRTAEEKGEPELKKRCLDILKSFPDGIQHSKYNFPSYEICGIPRAYAFMQGYLPEDGELVRKYAEEMMNATRDSKGIMSYPHQPEKELIWIDVAMAVTPFLLFAGLALGEDRYIDEAVNQSFLMYDEFFNPDNGLLHQSKNFNGPGRYSEDHWSRGNGWGYIALTELIRFLPENSKHRKKVEDYFVRHSQAFLPHQSKRGLWRQEIPFEYSYEESSGTALILYGLGVGLREGVLDEKTFREPFERGIRGLFAHCVNADFSTNNSCPGCLCPGEGEEKGTVKAYVTLKLPHKDEHHSFGPFMLAFVEAHLNGITDLSV